MTTTQKTDVIEVWVADDDPDDHLLFQLAVDETDLDMSLSFSLNGVELLQRLAESPIDALPALVVLDLRMPGLGGIRTLEMMRQDPASAKIPVVVFTTSTRDEDRESALAAGADFVVVKPIRFSQMVEFAGSLAWRAARSA